VGGIGIGIGIGIGKLQLMRFNRMKLRLLNSFHA
jgi:mannitol-1-phosphate/altronate dehydrogenase